jgi:hypothetical protein
MLHLWQKLIKPRLPIPIDARYARDARESMMMYVS